MGDVVELVVSCDKTWVVGKRVIDPPEPGCNPVCNEDIDGVVTSGKQQGKDACYSGHKWQPMEQEPPPWGIWKVFV